MSENIKSDLVLTWGGLFCFLFSISRVWINFLFKLKCFKMPFLLYFFTWSRSNVDPPWNEKVSSWSNWKWKSSSIKVLQLISVTSVYHFKLDSSGSKFSWLSRALAHLNAVSPHTTILCRKTLWTQGHMRTFPSSAIGTCVHVCLCVWAQQHPLLVIRGTGRCSERIFGTSHLFNHQF